MLLLRSKQARNRICAPRRVWNAAASATHGTRTLRQRYTSAGNLTQPIQWSSECYDTETALVYYNYRYYNPQDGRWTRRDPIGIESGMNLYGYVRNNSFLLFDYLGSYATTLDGLVPYELEIASKEAIEAAIRAAVEQAAYARKKCKNCNPCIPEEGTLMYALHQSGHTHFCKSTKTCADKGHTHYYIVQQTAFPESRCFAKRYDQYSVPGNHAAGIPYVEPAGGGPALP